MLFRQQFWPGLTDGTVTMAFRRWRRPTVKVGGTLQTPGGVLGIDEVARICMTDITDDDARSAGYRDREDVVAGLRPEGDLYRIRFHRVGDDPRVSMRANDRLDAAEGAQLTAALQRLSWAVPTLRLIEQHPATVSTDLAASAGVDRLKFKQRVRRLKELGLTESLVVGYQLSPRGVAFLRRVDG